MPYTLDKGGQYFDMTKLFYSIPEVASLLGISIKTVRRYIAGNYLDALKIGGVYRIPKDALESFINVGKKVIDSSKYGLKGNFLARKEEVPSDSQETVPNPCGKEEKINWYQITDKWTRPSRSSFTFVDLFCGAGGLSKGLEMAGLKGICGLDWFKEAGMTYRRNFNHPLVEGDITTPEVKEAFYSTVKKQLRGRQLTVVAGGFPCQGFSMSGNRIVDDPRNSLYKEMLEIVKTLKPLYVICENVVGLRTMLDGMVEQKILSDFQNAGYQMNVATLCAAEYGVPQKRNRVIFIGNRIGAKNYHPQPFLDEAHFRTTESAIADLMEHPEDPAFNHVPTKHSLEMQQRLLAVPEGQSLYEGYSDAWKKCPWHEASCTIKENHGGVNIHPLLPRVLTAREMARIQSFPDDFIFEGNKSKQLVQIGNAVPPLLGKAIGLAVRASAEEARKKDKAIFQAKRN